MGIAKYFIVRLIQEIIMIIIILVLIIIKAPNNNNKRVFFWPYFPVFRHFSRSEWLFVPLKNQKQEMQSKCENVSATPFLESKNALK